MQVIALEEHIVIPELLAAWSRLPGFDTTEKHGFGEGPLAQNLRESGDARISKMLDQGIDVQVLSLNTPGVQTLPSSDSVTVAREANDALAAILASNTSHFQAFATLPTPRPDVAAVELERAVTRLEMQGAMIYGRTGDRHADDRQMDAIYSVAERLRAPLYLHPQEPAEPVRHAYYSGLGQKIDEMFATFGIGYYYDTGVELLRMIFSGVFDRYPELQVIVGHWGEVILFYLDHIVLMQERGMHLDRPLGDYFRQNVWVTASGVLSERYLRWTKEVMGSERMMYSTDYPFQNTSTDGGRARRFLETSSLTQSERETIASDNWNRLTASIHRR